jgi:hypothetical protein
MQSKLMGEVLVGGAAIELMQERRMVRYFDEKQ